jgi:phosphatidate cytidylyltransferase
VTDPTPGAAPDPSKGAPADPKPASGTKTRWISGIIAALIAFPPLAFGDALVVGAVALVATLICMYEFVGMALPGERRTAFPLMVLLGLPVFAASAVSTSMDALPAWATLAYSSHTLLALVFAMVASSAWFLFSAKTTDHLADRWARFVLGILYVPFLIGLFPALRALDGGAGWLWAPLFASWGGDIGGYFAGRAFGKTPMFPLISPKKTWAGFFGGAALAIVALLVFKVLFFPRMSYVDCVVLAVVCDLSGVFGDLIESMVKRTYGVKDSGTIMPGHGGLLDRIDSTIFALPAAYLYLVLVRPLLGA